MHSQQMQLQQLEPIMVSNMLDPSPEGTPDPAVHCARRTLVSCCSRPLFACLIFGSGCSNLQHTSMPGHTHGTLHNRHVCVNRLSGNSIRFMLSDTTCTAKE